MLHFGTDQWVLPGGDLILPPREHLAVSGEIFACQNLGMGCYWQLVGRGQGYC